MDPQTPLSTPRQQDIISHQHVATPHTASPSTTFEALQYNEAMNAVSKMTLNSPKKSTVPRSCRSVWQAHGGGKRGRSPLPPLDRNNKPKYE